MYTHTHIHTHKDVIYSLTSQLHSLPQYQHPVTRVLHLLQLMNLHQYTLIIQSKEHQGSLLVFYNLWTWTNVSIYLDMYLSLWNHTQYIHCPKIHLGSTYSSLLPISQSLTATDFLTICIVLPFPECHSQNYIVCRLFRLVSFTQ